MTFVRICSKTCTRCSYSAYLGQPLAVAGKFLTYYWFERLWDLKVVLGGRNSPVTLLAWYLQVKALLSDTIATSFAIRLWSEQESGFYYRISTRWYFVGSSSFYDPAFYAETVFKEERPYYSCWNLWFPTAKWLSYL